MQIREHLQELQLIVEVRFEPERETVVRSRERCVAVGEIMQRRVERCPALRGDVVGTDAA